MAAPAALAGVGIGASLLGGIVGAIGSAQGGQAQANMYRYQQGMSLVNQQIEKQNAAYALRSGEVQAEQSGMKTRAEVGETLARQGASNLDVGSGSSAAVRNSEELVGAQEQGIIRSNAARTAYGFEVEATQAGAQAQLYGMAADQSITAGNIGAFGSILGGAGSVSSKWLQARGSGVPGF